MDTKLMAILRLLTMGLLIPFGILFIAGTFVSIVWLAILGKWGIIGLGLVSAMVFGLIENYILSSSGRQIAMSLYYAEQNRKFMAFLFGIFYNFDMMAYITVWCCGVLYFLLKDANASTFVPLLIFSYCVATGLWCGLAIQDGGFASLFITLAMNVSYFIVSWKLYTNQIQLIQALKLFSLLMFFVFLIQGALGLILGIFATTVRDTE